MVPALLVRKSSWETVALGCSVMSLIVQILKRQTEMIFFHLTQILLSADKRINFIPIKPNGNCYAAMATDILRTLVRK